MIVTTFVIFWLVVAWNVYFYIAYRKQSVAGKVVLITGGGSGIGRGMAIKFAALGARVVLWDVDTKGLKKVEAEIVADGGKVSTYVVDVSNRALVYQTAATVGAVDILINNAGIVTGKSILDCPDELMEKTVQVNTIAHFWTIKAFLPDMLARDSGHVVTVASAAGLSGVAGLVDYCASKFGAVGTAESLHCELRRRKCEVRTTLVCPFFINTGMFDGVPTKMPLLLPILEEQWAVDRIVLGVQRREEQVCMPALIGLAMLAKVLPVPWQLFALNLLGVNDSMSDFKGRDDKAKAK